MRATPVLPELIDDGRGPCARCVRAVEAERVVLETFSAGPGLRSVFVACACAGRAPRMLFGFRHDNLMVAASVAKLAWATAAVRAHRAGRLDLLAPMSRGDLGESAYRDVLACLPARTRLPWVDFLGLALVTSANPAFDHLSRTPGLAADAAGLGVDVVVRSGFSDPDLDGPVRGNLISARAAAELLVAVNREATGPLLPLVAGLANGARTTRLVRDAEDQPGLPVGFCAPNKTGTLSGVRNDVALFHDGPNALVVAVLTDRQADGVMVDGELARVGSQLVAARWTP